MGQHQMDGNDVDRSQYGSERDPIQIQNLRQENNSTLMKRSFTDNADIFSERKMMGAKGESNANIGQGTSSFMSERNKDEAIRQLQSQNEELSKIIESMAQDMKSIREQQQQTNFLRTQ